MTDFFKFADLAGWDGGQQIDVLLQYIENQLDDECFRDHLQEECGGLAGDDAGFDATVDAAGWCGAEQIDVLVNYIENQGDDEAFRNHLFEAGDGQVEACDACGVLLSPEKAIACPECVFEFCDKCYDTAKGEGCQSHPEVKR